MNRERPILFGSLRQFAAKKARPGRARRSRRARRARNPIAAIGATTAVLGLLAATAARACGIALVLAVDVSSSVDAAEFELMRAGHAAAFRDPAVVAALLSAGGARAAMMHWSGQDHQRLAIGWTALDDEAQIAAFAADLAGARRRRVGLMTAPAPALSAARALFEAPRARACARRIVDVSGDGARNEGPPVAEARARLLAAGATINGLAVGHPLRLIGAEVDAWRYYERRLIGGPGAFVETVDDFADYAAAFRRKLLRELSVQVGAAERRSPQSLPGLRRVRNRNRLGGALR